MISYFLRMMNGLAGIEAVVASFIKRQTLGSLFVAVVVNFHIMHNMKILTLLTIFPHVQR